MIFGKKRENSVSDAFGQTVSRKKLPRLAVAFYITALASAVIFIGFLISESFADFFNRYVSSLFRAFMAKIFGFVPFSVAELLIILLPAIAVILIVRGMKHYTATWRDVGIFCLSLLSVGALVFSMFTVGFAAGYRGSTIDKKLGIERADVSAQELYNTALILTEAINSEVDKIVFSESGSSVMPYGYDEMNDKLLSAYETVSNKYSFVQKLDSRLKPVMLSNLMSYTHITGVYTFFTGEANINVAFPDYTVPYTAAHELAHQRGVAREDEANFMAFLVCLESDDAYIRYSGYLNLCEYVLSALASADRELYYLARETLSTDVRGEMAAYSRFFDKYRESVASNVSEKVNNTFLIIQGTEGTKSYGMVVDLAVAYYKQ